MSKQTPRPATARTTATRPAPSGDPRMTHAITAVAKTLGPGTVLTLDATATSNVKVIPTGSLALDTALGVGGYPRGRVVEIYGPESSGKTTLALHAIAQAQRAGGIAAFVDAEHAFDLRYAKAIGVESSRLLVSQPDYGEQALDVVEVLARTGLVDLIVIDSVAALTPKVEIDGEMGDQHVGLQARLMSRAMRKLAGAAYRTNTTLLFINQLRQKIGVMFGSPETTTGGQALKFYSSLRLDIRRGARVSVGDSLVGNRTRVKVVKNKIAAPFSEAEFDIRWGSGIDREAELLELGVSTGVVEQKGSHYSVDGTRIGHGRENARRALLADEKLQRSIVAALDRAKSQPASQQTRPPKGQPRTAA